MPQRTLTIVNKLGLHARAAAKFVTLASKFESDIVIDFKGHQVNGKSIMGIMMLAAAKGSEIAISASGPDEQAALDELSELVNNRFGEDQ